MTFVYRFLSINFMMLNVPELINFMINFMMLIAR